MTDEPLLELSPREVAAEYVTGTVFDIAECVREPIHLLGSVQSHGALLALGEPDLAVAVASTNTGAVLGTEPEALVGAPVASLVGTDQAARLQAALAGGDSAVVPIEIALAASAPAQFEVSVHRADGLLICEFEPLEGQPFRFSAFYAGVRRALLRMQGTQSVDELCGEAVRQVRSFTGYDRVVAYRFDGDGPGEVIAEDVAPGWEPWLGLWFPASDVPPQARRLYRQNWIRVIADVDDPGAALLPPRLPGTGQPLDLSGSALRTVSGYHLEYLRNIGVRASMSVSLIKDDQLWGLIACHSGTPRRLSPDQRAACEMFGIALSLQLEGVGERQRAVGETRARRVLSQVLDSASDDDPADFVERLVAEAAPLSELVSADGVYVRFGGAWRASGLLPPVESLPDLFGLLPVTSAGRPWSTHRLGDELGDRGELAGDCAGLMLVRMGSGDDVVAWFRGDASLNVRWATDPSRPVVLGSRGQRLTPRGSSMVWHETARGQSAPWTEEEHGIAEESYRWLFEFAVRRAAALSAANVELARSNDELDAFAYVASHDLKEPLRGVANYATFIAEDATGLDEQTLVRLATIRRLVTRMDGLLNSLLEYSRLGRADLAAEEIPLDTLVDEIAEMLGPQLAEAGVELRRPMPLGSVSGDRIRVQEVLVNLITNAVKYAAESAPRWVEVGVARVVPDGSSEPVPAIYVWDNGIGIRPEQQENIFKIFRRLHAPGVRGGGAGAGLTISRRIVERHGGRLWVRSVPGEGSTFYFTL